jgi:hypothetical protein
METVQFSQEIERPHGDFIVDVQAAVWPGADGEPRVGILSCRDRASGRVVRGSILTTDEWADIEAQAITEAFAQRHQRRQREQRVRSKLAAMAEPTLNQIAEACCLSAFAL